jgi:hypothetical protein
MFELHVVVVGIIMFNVLKLIMEIVPNSPTVNGALITLLPKKDGAVELTDFRPISLVHSFAKLLAKILALRLAPKLPQLVDANQSAFVRGRCIHDNFVLV